MVIVALLSLFALLLFCVWALLAYRWPLQTFAVLFFSILTLHERTQLENLLGNITAATSGGASFVDILWLGFLLGAGLSLAPKFKLKTSLQLPSAIWLLLPYTLCSIFLPILGAVILYIQSDSGLSYLSTGARQLQWFLLAVFAFGLAQKFSTRSLLSILVNTVLASVLFHAAYASMQWLVTEGVLPPSLRYIDTEYFSNNEWFKRSPRPTGFTLRPTALALIGTIGLSFALAELTNNTRGRISKLLLLVGSMTCLLFSSDRLILLGAVSAVFAVGALLVFRQTVRLRTTIGALASVLLAPALLFILPEYHRIRITRLFSEQLFEEQNISERVERWVYYLNDIVPSYPLGTGIQPTYAGTLPVDNYYLTTFVQGNVLYLLFFLVFMLGLLWLSLNLLQRNYPNTFLGSSLAFLTVATLISSVGAAPLFDVPYIASIWILTGASLAAYKV